MRQFWHNAYLHLDKYWSPTHLVAIQSYGDWKYMWAFLATIVVSFLGILLVFVLKKRVRPSLRTRINSLLWTYLPVSGILFFVRQQQIPLLGMDLWRFLFELAIVVWIVSIIRFYRTAYRRELVQEKIEERRNKYLPKSA
jgi:hypothetical protein